MDFNFVYAISQYFEQICIFDFECIAQ